VLCRIGPKERVIYGFDWFVLDLQMLIIFERRQELCRIFIRREKRKTENIYNNLHSNLTLNYYGTHAKNQKTNKRKKKVTGSKPLYCTSINTYSTIVLGLVAIWYC